MSLLSSSNLIRLKSLTFSLLYNFIMCHPYLVSTGSEILLSISKLNAAFSNGIELICPLENGFNLPPLKEEFLSSEYL